MRYDAKSQQSAQRDAHLAYPAEHNRANHAHASSDSHNQEQPASLLGPPPSHMYPGISTERIMHAVERQRRITAQLEDLRAQQRQRTAFLRTAGLKLITVVGFLLGLLIIALVTLFFFQPIMLARTLALLSDTIALLLAVGESLKTDLSLIPSNNWLLSGATLLIVLMMVMWLRLMRHPQDV
jgi:hypothetical protein